MDSSSARYPTTLPTLQVLYNVILAIHEQHYSLQYNQQQSQPTTLGIQRQLLFQGETTQNSMSSRHHTPTLQMSQHPTIYPSYKCGYLYQSSSKSRSSRMDIHIFMLSLKFK
jgi:hypothetical protein